MLSARRRFQALQEASGLRRVKFAAYPALQHSRLHEETFRCRKLVELASHFSPVTTFLEFSHASPVAIFVTSCLAIIPLAGLMGKATEHLAEKMGAGIGGLLNATFGNAAELIIAALALHKGLHGVVKASITGSIIGNILLVLGLSMFGGRSEVHAPTIQPNRCRIGVNAVGTQRRRLVDSGLFHGWLKTGSAAAQSRRFRKRYWNGA